MVLLFFLVFPREKSDFMEALVWPFPFYEIY